MVGVVLCCVVLYVRVFVLFRVVWGVMRCDELCGVFCWLVDLLGFRVVLSCSVFFLFGCVCCVF